MVNTHDTIVEQTREPGPERRQTADDRILDGIAWLCMLFAGCALVVVIVTFGWLVYGRYILNDTPTWVEQLSLLLISYITFLGAAVGVRRNSHLNIDFIRESLPFIPRVVMRYFADLLVVVFGVLMAREGWTLVFNNINRKIPMLGVMEGWRPVPLVICGVLMVVFAGHNIIVRVIRRGNDGV